MFSVAGYDNLNAIGKAHDFLVQAYDEGLSFEDFRIRTNAYFRNQGLAAPDRFHLRTVFETNMQSAYMAGRIRRMLENVDERPYWRILTAGDDRVRPAHRALHGKIFHYQELLDRGLIPPFDYNCRCTIQALTAEQIQQMGLKVEDKALAIYDDPETGLPVNIRPREGFGHNPDEYNFGLMEFKQEMIKPLLEGNIIDSKNANRPERNIVHPKNEATEFINYRNYLRSNPDLTNDEKYNYLKDSIIKNPKFKSLLLGGERFELFLDSPFKDKILFSENSLRHLMKYPDRIIDLENIFDTIQNPWEVWVNQNKNTKEWGFSFIKLFRGKDQDVYCRVDIYVSGGARITTAYKISDLNYLESNRRGIALIYVNDDLVEIKK